MQFVRTTKSIISTILLCIALFMALRVAYGCITQSDAMTNMFTPRGVVGIGLVVLGIISLISGILLLHPSTYQIGNAITLGVILFIIIMFIKDENYQGILIELPFLVLSIAIALLPHPISLQ